MQHFFLVLPQLFILEYCWSCYRYRFFLYYASLVKICKCLLRNDKTESWLLKDPTKREEGMRKIQFTRWLHVLPALLALTGMLPQIAALCCVQHFNCTFLKEALRIFSLRKYFGLSGGIDFGNIDLNIEFADMDTFLREKFIGKYTIRFGLVILKF